MRITTFAAIYVGSYEVSLKITEISAKRKIREIDLIRSRIGIGRNIYKHKKVETEVMEELCEILSEYEEIMKSYRVDAYRVYAGAFLKDAGNVLFVLEQIRIRTGLTLQILSNSERRFIGYQSVAAREEFDAMTKEGAAVVDVGGESIQITLFSEGGVVTTQHLVLGTMRLREQLAGIGNTVARFEKQMEELINKEIEVFKAMYLKKRELRYLIFLGDYSLELMESIQGNGEIKTAKTEVFAEHLKELGRQTPEDVAEQLKLSTVDPLLLPSIVMYRCIAQELGTGEVWVPGNNISDGMAYQYASENKLLKSVHDFDNDVLSAATNLSKRYHSYSPHIDALTQMATLIFDTMKKIHGLGKRERLLLQVAAILHDCGKYISLANGPLCSYDIIMASEIIGLTHMEREIVAYTVLYNTYPLPAYEDFESDISRESYVVIAKLSAILRVSNAMDRSHKQKFKNVRAAVKGKELVITIETDDDIALEKALFDAKVSYFENIFSIKPVVKEKRVY